MVPDWIVLRKTLSGASNRSAGSGGQEQPVAPSLVVVSGVGGQPVALLAVSVGTGAVSLAVV